MWFDLVIVGGGLASARAIKSYREAGGDGRIALISRDSTLPYHRPPLSKRFLRAIDYDFPAWAEEYMERMETTLGEAYSEPAADVRGYIDYVRSNA